MLLFARKFLTGLIGLTWIVASIALVAAIALLFLPSATLLASGTAEQVDIGSVRWIVVGALAIVIAAAPCAHIVFSRMILLIRAGEAGRPFLPENAGRLQAIGWALLSIQVLDLALGAGAAILGEASALEVSWTPSVTGWLGVLLAFVLAHIFRQGAAMQADVEATF